MAANLHNVELFNPDTTRLLSPVLSDLTQGKIRRITLDPLTESLIARGEKESLKFPLTAEVVAGLNELPHAPRSYNLVGTTLFESRKLYWAARAVDRHVSPGEKSRWKIDIGVRRKDVASLTMAIRTRDNLRNCLLKHDTTRGVAFIDSREFLIQDGNKNGQNFTLGPSIAALLEKRYQAGSARHLFYDDGSRLRLEPVSKQQGPKVIRMLKVEFLPYVPEPTVEAAAPSQPVKVGKPCSSEELDALWLLVADRLMEQGILAFNYGFITRPEKGCIDVQDIKSKEEGDALAKAMCPFHAESIFLNVDGVKTPFVRVFLPPEIS